MLLVALTACTQRYESYTDIAQVNGVELFYAAEGSGKPVILIHGNGGSHNDMETTQRELAQAGYMVYALDSRDHVSRHIGSNCDRRSKHICRRIPDSVICKRIPCPAEPESSHPHDANRACHDPSGHADHTHLIASNIPGAELKIIPGEDHGSYICNSSKLTALLLDFFDRIGY